MLKKILTIGVLLTLTAVSAMATGAGDDSEKPIRIGMYADLTGPTALWGTNAEKGARLRIKNANENGGILGRQVELVIYDCQLSPTEAIKAYTRLVQEDGVVAVNGSLISNTALAVSPVAAELKVPVVARAMDERATTPGFDPDNPDAMIDPNPYFFLLQPSAFQQAAAIAGYAIDELGMDTFSMLYTPGNAYALYLAKGFEHYVNLRGKTMLKSFEFQMGDSDFKTQITAIKQLNPDGLFIPNYTGQNATIAKQAVELGLKSRMLGNNSWYKPMDEVAGAAADGAYFPHNISPDDPSLKWYYDLYDAEYGEEAGLNSFAGWDDVGFILQAIEKAGSTDSIAIAEAMGKTRNYEGIIGTINMSLETHRPVDLPMPILYYDHDQVKTAELRYLPVKP
jgi:branched-chain amino acid transport system substrate-binding protein